jgi:hypothetical protein
MFIGRRHNHIRYIEPIFSVKRRISLSSHYCIITAILGVTLDISDITEI